MNSGICGIPSKMNSCSSAFNEMHKRKVMHPPRCSQGKIMKLVIDYVEDVKEKLGMESDAALGKHLGGSRSLVSTWRNDGRIPDDYYCIRIGQILGIDPLIVISAANYEREKSSERKEFWQNFNSGRTGKIIGTALIVLLGMQSPEQVQGISRQSAAKLTSVVYIMSSYLKHWLKRIRRIIQQHQNQNASFTRWCFFM